MDTGSKFSRVVVAGGGTMGTGIAYVAALAGAAVTVIEPDDARAAVLGRELRRAAADSVRRGKLETSGAESLLARIDRVACVGEAPYGADVAVETVPERLPLKHEVLRQLAATGPGLIGTNTSAMSIDLLAEALPDPSRFLGLHFFQPVWSFKFLEIIRGTATSPAAVAMARAFAGALGKESIVVRNVPGFATSRLDLVSSLEAMRMFEDGVASAEDIDRASVLAFRHPIGPLRLSDMVGLDVRLDIARVLQAEYGERYAPPAILARMVERGDLGRKTGRGFFNWSEESP